MANSLAFVVKGSRTKVGVWCGNVLRWLHQIYLANWRPDRPKSHLVRRFQLLTCCACIKYIPHALWIIWLRCLKNGSSWTCHEPPIFSILPFRTNSDCQMVSEKLPAVVVLEDWCERAPKALDEEGPQHDCNMQVNMWNPCTCIHIYIYIHKLGAFIYF